jgi:hypothetical protein
MSETPLCPDPGFGPAATQGKSGFIRFEVIERKPKTNVYDAFSLRHGDLLGRIYWYGAWHQYVFEAQPGTVWSDGCLADVHGVLRSLKELKG